MPPTDKWKVHVQNHAGSTMDEIASEPAWGSTNHEHYIGFRNRQGRRPGVTEGYAADIQSSWDKLHKPKKAMKEGRLINFRDVIQSEEDFHTQHPENPPSGWRFVLDYSEKEIKEEQDWPANKKKREEEKKEQEEEEEQEEGKDKASEKTDGGDSSDDDDQHEEKGEEAKDDEAKDEEADLTPHQRAFHRAVKHESERMKHLKSNDGKGRANVRNRTPVSIDEADQFTPDNWIPRSAELIRLTGKHPLNAEPPLHRLFESSFITPNELHYVRSHGAVPHLLRENHGLEVEWNGRSTRYSMDEIRGKFDTLNLPVLIACDNGRRKEMNMIKRTTGFNWGPGAVGCAYWKGPLLRDVLVAAGVPERMPNEDKQRYWMHFRGADDHGGVHYETSVTFEYAMDPVNDLLLAYEMNDEPIPPDHGYPLRLVIPGYVGGRHVKWLEKIWISDKENDSYYHIWDNRIVPEFITENSSEIAKYFFHHPDTAAYELHLNSVVTVPQQGEKLELKNVTKGQEYRIRGYAFNGRGDQVQRVEVSLDDGKSWLYCIREFPKAPVRHGRKFWTWCFWYVDVDIGDLIRAPGITVRCFDVKKITQPEKPIWNISGTMNNGQYTVRPELVHDETPHILFRHPVEAGNGNGGWMKESVENQIADAKRKTDAPGKQFTRSEIEKHDNEKDCWIVVENCVYDATSVLSWHPGGAASILAHAGKVHQETTEEFSSIHDGYAWQKLNECILGTVTEKAKKYIAEQAEHAKSEDGSSIPEDQALQKHRWNLATLVDRRKISHDTTTLKFALPGKTKYLGIGTCQHIEMGFHMRDRMLIRSYTPTKPVLSRESKVQTEEKDLHDGTGTFELTVKTYFPDKEQPGGAFSNILHELVVGEQVEMRGPAGDIIYNGHGKFTIYGEERTFKRVSLVLGGTGLTPGYSMIARACLTEDDETEIRVIDANKAEGDILLRDDLDRFEEKKAGQITVTHVLSEPSDEWEGLKGHVTEEMIKDHLFPPEDGNIVLLCGPPPMIQKAVLPALEKWGYAQDKNMFGL